MGVRRVLARAASGRVHVLVAEMPGGFLARVALEQELARRGWVAALSPAGADVLAVCGSPGGSLADRVDDVYDQLPGPRALVHVLVPDQVRAALDAAAQQLRDTGAQRRDARSRVSAGERSEDHGDTDHGNDHGDTDHGDTDHGDMEMAPAGIPLAEGAEDRDGLEMDVLHLPLGPVLPHWPAGLVVRCSLHGDVAADVRVERLSAPPGPREARGSRGPGAPGYEAARRLDAVVAVLALAGSAPVASVARSARDLCLAADPAAAVRVAALRRRLGRARLLGWLLRGLGVLPPEAVPAQVRETLAGDVRDRLLHLVDEAHRLLTGTTAGTPYDAVDLLPGVLAGLELASVRLVVASLAPFLVPVSEAVHA